MLLTYSLLIILTGGFFTGCQNDEIFTNNKVGLMLKSGEIVFGQACNSASYELKTNENVPVGLLDVSDDGTYLKIEFIADGIHSFSEVHLWVGTNTANAPVNKQGIPEPGRFTVNDKGLNKYVFYLKLTELLNTTGQTGGKDLYVCALALLDDSGNNGVQKISAWSEGTDFGTSTQSYYNVYTTCLKTGGGGCFPHSAFCGKQINEIYYFRNISGKRQNIIADNGEFAGEAEYKDGKILFYLGQDWILSDSNPEVQVQGFYEPNATGSQLYSISPIFKVPSYYVPVSDYPFYVIQLNLQYCTTN